MDEEKEGREGSSRVIAAATAIPKVQRGSSSIWTADAATAGMLSMGQYRAAAGVAGAHC